MGRAIEHTAGMKHRKGPPDVAELWKTVTNICLTSSRLVCITTRMWLPKRKISSTAFSVPVASKALREIFGWLALFRSASHL